MFRLREPSHVEIQRFLTAAATRPLSYSDVGIASRSDPAGYQLDKAEVLLGTGEAAFERAAMAVLSWKMLDLGWMKATPSAELVAPSVDVAVVVSHLGFWSLNGCRVVYMLSSEGGTERCGFAYGTLSDHAEEGEELFEVSLDRSTGEVFYRLRAASRPSALLARLGHPYTRLLQAKFRTESCRRMKQVMNDAST